MTNCEAEVDDNQSSWYWYVMQRNEDNVVRTVSAFKYKCRYDYRKAKKGWMDCVVRKK